MSSVIARSTGCFRVFVLRCNSRPAPISFTTVRTVVPSADLQRESYFPFGHHANAVARQYYTFSSTNVGLASHSRPFTILTSELNGGSLTPLLKNSSLCKQNSGAGIRFLHSSATYSIENKSKTDAAVEKTGGSDNVEDVPKPTLFARFKQMYKDYWYVLIPVHVITSVGWFGSFYFSVKNGLDVVALLEHMGVSEKIISPLKGSNAGYLALAYAMYKVATPARYAVTLGGTTVSINYLTRWGYIKPVPSADQLKMMYQDRKEKYRNKYNVKRDAFRKKLRQHKSNLKKRMASSRKRVNKK